VFIPMPGGAGDDARRELEAWLRDVGFPPASVPWPIRIVVGETLVFVWVNNGEPGGPGQPRPRCWRSSYVDQPFPFHVVAQLGGAAARVASLGDGMALLDSAGSAADLPKETR
jgi:hypothetical protein